MHLAHRPPAHMQYGMLHNVMALLVIGGNHHTFSSAQNCTAAGTSVPHSDRTSESPCVGRIGDECAYNCDAGYIRIGRHVCQTYTQGGSTIINRSFFGGRCDRLCAATASPCPSGSVPTRVNRSDSDGPCLRTTCATPDMTLRKLARSNYELWQLARNNATGIYLASVVLDGDRPQNYAQGSTAQSGLGMITDCIAAAMGWITQDQAQTRILQTLGSLSGQRPGFRLAQNRRGFVPTFIDSYTGAVFGNKTGTQQFALMSTGPMHAGIMFVKTYFERTYPESPSTTMISKLATSLFTSVEWSSLLCGDDGKLDANGTNIPMLVDWADGCSAPCCPLHADGYYEWNEEMIAVAFAFATTCGGQPPGQCTNKGIERMWQRWQGRRTHPNYDYKGHPLLSLWASYVVHLPYYLVSAFNRDEVYTSLFESHWRAEWAFYNSSSYYGGDDGRYGLGAGPLDTACSKGQAYLTVREIACKRALVCRDSHCDNVSLIV